MNYELVLNRSLSNYELLLHAYTGVYLRMIQPGSEVTPLAVRQLREQATGMARAFGEQLKADIAEFKESLGYSGTEYDAKFEPQLAALLEANVGVIVRALRESKSDLSKMMGGAHGAMGQLVQKRIQNPEFKSKDSAGRTWQAAKLFAFLLRNWLYGMEIKATLDGITDKGGDLARVVYSNPEHKNNGLVFSISGATAGYPSLASIEASVFHYNATAEVEGVYP